MQTVREDLELGRKTRDMLVRVLTLHQLGSVDTSYGRKGELAQMLGCDVRALDRALNALREVAPEVESLVIRIKGG